jgi:hypothetical protein
MTTSERLAAGLNVMKVKPYHMEGLSSGETLCAPFELSMMTDMGWIVSGTIQMEPGKIVYKIRRGQ